MSIELLLVLPDIKVKFSAIIGEYNYQSGKMILNRI